MNRRQFLKKSGLLVGLAGLWPLSKVLPSQGEHFDTKNAKITVHERWHKPHPLAEKLAISAKKTQEVRAANAINNSFSSGRPIL